MLQSHARPRPSIARHALPAIFACALVALIAGASLVPTGAWAAAEPAEPTKAGPAEAEVVESDAIALPTDEVLERALQPEAKAEARSLDPELQAVLDRERAELEVLRERFENASDHATAIAVQQAIDALKQHAEIELLQIQARRMRERGLEEQATELEQTVASMLERLPRRSDSPVSADPR